MNIIICISILCVVVAMINNHLSEPATVQTMNIPPHWVKIASVSFYLTILIIAAWAVLNR